MADNETPEASLYQAFGELSTALAEHDELPNAEQAESIPGTIGNAGRCHRGARAIREV